MKTKFDPNIYMFKIAAPSDRPRRRWRESGSGRVIDAEILSSSGGGSKPPSLGPGASSAPRVNPNAIVPWRPPVQPPPLPPSGFWSKVLKPFSRNLVVGAAYAAPRVAEGWATKHYMDQRFPNFDRETATPEQKQNFIDTYKKSPAGVLTFSDFQKSDMTPVERNVLLGARASGEVIDHGFSQYVASNPALAGIVSGLGVGIKGLSGGYSGSAGEVLRDVTADASMTASPVVGGLLLKKMVPGITGPSIGSVAKGGLGYLATGTGNSWLQSKLELDQPKDLAGMTSDAEKGTLGNFAKRMGMNISSGAAGGSWGGPWGAIAGAFGGASKSWSEIRNLWNKTKEVNSELDLSRFKNIIGTEGQPGLLSDPRVPLSRFGDAPNQISLKGIPQELIDEALKARDVSVAQFKESADIARDEQIPIIERETRSGGTSRLNLGVYGEGSDSSGELARKYLSDANQRRTEMQTEDNRKEFGKAMSVAPMIAGGAGAIYLLKKLLQSDRKRRKKEESLTRIPPIPSMKFASFIPRYKLAAPFSVGTPDGSAEFPLRFRLRPEGLLGAAYDWMGDPDRAMGFVQDYQNNSPLGANLDERGYPKTPPPTGAPLAIPPAGSSPLMPLGGRGRTFQNSTTPQPPPSFSAPPSSVPVNAPLFNIGQNSAETSIPLSISPVSTVSPAPPEKPLPAPPTPVSKLPHRSMFHPFAFGQPLTPGQRRHYDPDFSRDGTRTIPATGVHEYDPRKDQTMVSRRGVDSSGNKTLQIPDKYVPQGSSGVATVTHSATPAGDSAIAAETKRLLAAQKARGLPDLPPLKQNLKTSSLIPRWI